MLEKIILKKPIMINGTEVKELTYDFDELTVEDYTNAETAKARSMGSTGSMVQKVAQVDSSLHIYLALAAVIAVNRNYDFIDLIKIKGFDVVKLMKAGQSFFTSQAVTESAQDNSENSQESTQNITVSP